MTYAPIFEACLEGQSCASALTDNPSETVGSVWCKSGKRPVELARRSDPPDQPAGTQDAKSPGLKASYDDWITGILDRNYASLGCEQAANKIQGLLRAARQQDFIAPGTRYRRAPFASGSPKKIAHALATGRIVGVCILQIPFR